MASAATDARFMARALALAARGLGRTHPNPPVGAVFVKGGRVVGEGFHRRAGGPHAEIEALRRAGARARGADLYVTLEPCAHHGRTPPCVEALLPLGLRRVVVAQVDPNPLVRGRSLRRLRAAGVAVDVGPGVDEAARLLAGFSTLVRTGRPLVTLKLAATLDGRIATASGDARWITGPAARRIAHRLRDQHDAILVGAGTVRADDPALTCRLRGGRNPIRVIVAGRDLAIPARAHVLRTDEAPTWVMVPSGVSPRQVAALGRRGVEVVEVPSRGGTIAWPALGAALGARGLTTVLVEGGATIAAGALRAGVVDRLVWFAAPSLLGGDGLPAIGPLGIRRVASAVPLGRFTLTPCGPDLMITADVRRVASGQTAR